MPKDILDVVIKFNGTEYGFAYDLSGVPKDGRDSLARIVVNQFAKTLAESVLHTPFRHYTAGQGEAEIWAEANARH